MMDVLVMSIHIKYIIPCPSPMSIRNSINDLVHKIGKVYKWSEWNLSWCCEKKEERFEVL